MSEQEGIIDLSRAGFITTGIVGQLDMRDTVEMFLQRSRDIALHPLHVVDVVLNEETVGPDMVDDLNRLLRPVQEKAGNIERVDRLDQQANPFPRQRGRRKSKVLQKHLVEFEQVRVRRRDADQAIHLMAVETRRL